MPLGPKEVLMASATATHYQSKIKWEGNVTKPIIGPIQTLHRSLYMQNQRCKILLPEPSLL